MPVKKDSIDVQADDCKRLKKLIAIIENILEDTDPDEKNKDQRRWILFQFLYIIWWESTRASERTQGGGGPARGLIQMEPRTLADIVDNYVFGPAPKLIDNLAKAAGVSEEEMKDALDAFRKSVRKNTWPHGGDAGKVEDWLTNIDSFAVKIMRYHFKRFGSHSFPPGDDKNLDENPQAEAFKEEFSEGWATWWKRKFRSDEERDALIKRFEERARDLDKTLRDCG